MPISDATSSDPLINRTIEGYEFVKRVGEGSYGMVYLARHPRIKDRLVAVKYIKFTNPKEAEKVAREIDILARLKHPNVVDIYDAYRFEHYQLIVMELVRGGSLEESLKKINGLLDLRLVVEGIEQLAFALGYVHEQNVLHLDLKPGNVLLDPVAKGQTARFVLTDFGIAQVINPGSAMSTNMIGTPMYMSPEHFGFGDNKPDHRSDIYSLGVILYELVVGHAPFQSKQLLDLLNQHAYGPVPLPSDTVQGLPPALDNVILKAMAKAPEDRFQSASAMGSALREILLGPLSGIPVSTSGRVSGQALGAIAQAGADALGVIEAEHPAQKAEGLFSLVVMGPDGSQEVQSFEKESIIAGRDQAVDLRLDQKTVSRRHVQIDCDRQGNLSITDLDSANGSYLDGVRLTPQERVHWKANQFLQIQGFLVGVGGTAGSSKLQHLLTEQVVSLLNLLQDQHKRARVHLNLSPAIVYAELGKPQYIQVRVETENAPAAQYELRAKPGPGIDERWYTLPAGQTIQGGDTYTFDFIVSMPHVGTTGDRTHEIALQVVSDNAEIPSAYQILKVRVVPFTRFNVALRPSEISHNRRRRANLAIANTGNHTEFFSLEIEAPDLLAITPEAQQIEIDPGNERNVQLKFKPARNARRLRSRLVYAISVHAASGPTERANGSYIFPRQERVPLWVLVLWVLVLIVAGRLILFDVSIPDQFTQMRALVEFLVLKVRGG